MNAWLNRNVGPEGVAAVIVLAVLAAIGLIALLVMWTLGVWIAEAALWLAGRLS